MSSSHDQQAVVARVAGLADGEALAPEPDLGRVELARRPDVPLAVERRPVAGGGAREHRAGRLRRQRPDREDGGAGRGDEPRSGQPEPLEQRDDGGCREEDDGADGQHLVGAVLRHEPERRREGPGDAARGRDREQPPGRPAQPVDLARGEPDRDRRDGRQHDAHRAEEHDRRDERVEARARVPRDDLLEHPARRRPGSRARAPRPARSRRRTGTATASGRRARLRPSSRSRAR